MAIPTPTQAQLFGRKATAIVAKNDGTLLTVSGLRIQFKCHKTIRPQPSTLDMSITNLADSTRQQLQSKGAPVILSAGYDGAVQQIFSGRARTIDTVHLGPDVNTRIQCGDGEQEYQYGRANISLAPGTAVLTVLDKLADALGVGRGNLDDVFVPPGNFTQYVHGYAHHGSASRELDRVLGSLGYQWCIQDGQLVIFQPDVPSPHDIYKLTPDTGLLGSPEHGSPDQMNFKSRILKARSLLLPAILPRRRVQITTHDQTINGVYTVIDVCHQGDTDSNDWFTDMELRLTSEKPE